MVVFFILILFILVTILFTLNIRISLKNVKISNLENKGDNIDINIGLYILDKIKIVSKSLNIKKIKNISSKAMNYLKKNILLNIKERKKETIIIKIKELDLKINIGFQNIIYTIYLIPVLASIIVALVNTKKININNNRFKYTVKPVFNVDSFKYDVLINGIITINLVHIIIAIIKQKVSDKIGKSSNRKFNDNCYE